MIRKRKKEDKLLPGEKMIGFGFMQVIFWGSALDSPNLIVPVIGFVVGILIICIGEIIAKKEGSEYV